jgi:hypothetical protein
VLSTPSSGTSLSLHEMPIKPLLILSGTPL